VPVQIRLSNRLCVSTPRLTAGGFSRTLPAMCRFKFAFQTVCVSPTACVQRAALAAPFRQCAGSNSPFKLFAYCRQLVYGGRLSPHPSGSVPVQIRLSNRLCVSTPRLTAGGSRRTLLTFYLCFFILS